MKQKFVYLALVLMFIITCSACGKTTYNFDKMADNLHAENGEDYSIHLENNTVYITRTYTLPQGGRNREKLANLSQEDFDDWSKGWWYTVSNEQSEFEKVFHENGNDYEVLITYLLRDADGNEIGSIDVNGCSFTLEDLQPYRTIDHNPPKDSEKYNDQSAEESINESYGYIDVETAIMNTHAILDNYLDGQNVQFDTESLSVIAENVDEVMASDLTAEKPVSIINDGYVIEIEYDNAVIYWGLGEEADKVNVIEK